MRRGEMSMTLRPLARASWMVRDSSSRSQKYSGLWYPEMMKGLVGFIMVYLRYVRYANNAIKMESSKRQAGERGEECAGGLAGDEGGGIKIMLLITNVLFVLFIGSK